jgi:AmmeMemoRadiSam system protein B
MQARIREPAVAGQFYPSAKRALQEQVDALLARAPEPTEAAPKAIIAPHAGFMFSGSVAATAYTRWQPARERIRRVIILGPSHFVPLRGLALPRADSFRTSLGDMPVDAQAYATARTDPAVSVADAPHAREHSLETQLPFIQRVIGDVAVLPLVVGDATPDEVGRVLGALWGDTTTAISISSDLSHFYDDATARDLDTATARTIEALGIDRIGPDNACGFRPIQGLLYNADTRGASVRTLELKTSADAGAPPHSVVGYGAFELYEAAA